MKDCNLPTSSSATLSAGIRGRRGFDYLPKPNGFTAAWAVLRAPTMARSIRLRGQRRTARPVRSLPHAKMRTDMGCSTRSAMSGNGAGIVWILRDMATTEYSRAEVGTIRHGVAGSVSAGGMHPMPGWTMSASASLVELCPWTNSPTVDRDGRSTPTVSVRCWMARYQWGGHH